MSIEASVIIPARDVEKVIGTQLDALAEQQTTFSWEVIVADNKSSDLTERVVNSYKAKIPRLRIVKADEGNGAGYARNVGAAKANGRYLLFCDADDIVGTGWIQSLSTGLMKYDAVGGRLDESLLNSEESRILRRPLVLDHLPSVLGFPRAVSSNCGVNRQVFNDLEGFDTSYLHSQDSEFFIRLQVNGYSLGFVPEAVVYYRHGDDLWASLKKIYRWNRTRPRLYGQYREHGAIKQPKHGGRKWVVIFLTSWQLLAGKERRLHWLSSAIRSYGRLIGSIRYRTFFL